MDKKTGPPNGDSAAQWKNASVSNSLIPGAQLNLAVHFHTLFSGLDRAYGTYNNISYDHMRSDGKYKGDVETKRGVVTEELWQAHLDGKAGLGIVPIRSDGTCLFGAIDIDVYIDINHAAIASTAQKLQFPLVPCRSKSGGCHLYLFAAEPVTARLMQNRLREMAARLGHSTSEIFPKQAALKDDRDCGSWINMPYFDAADTNRYAIMTTGQPMSVEQFLDAAEKAKQPAEWFQGSLPRKSDALPDGPPCLQTLIDEGFPPGTWNTGCFNLGVYCRKAFPDDWQQQLRNLNAINFPPGRWPVSDLNPIIKSVGSKDYFYKCKDSPLKERCDRAACRQRKYGIGSANALPILSSLTKLETNPPIWFLDVEGHRVELSTSQLLNPFAFQEALANHQTIVPILKRAAWVEYIKDSVEKANVIPVADDGSGIDDTSPHAILRELLEQFCTRRAQAHSKEEILSGKSYTADGITRFRIGDFMMFCSQKGFKDFRRNSVVAFLKSIEGKSRQEWISGRNEHVWSIPEFSRESGPGSQDQGGSGGGF